jgi:hypothetical protein
LDDVEYQYIIVGMAHTCVCLASSNPRSHVGPTDKVMVGGQCWMHRVLIHIQLSQVARPHPGRRIIIICI